METILEADAQLCSTFISKCFNFLNNSVYEEAIMLLGVKDELQKLLQTIKRIRWLLKDAERRNFDDSSVDLRLSELKDVLSDANGIIERCKIESIQLLADQNFENNTSPVCCDFFSTFSPCLTSLPPRYDIVRRIKELNVRLQQIYGNRKQFKLEKFEMFETRQISFVNSRQTCSLVDPLVVGEEVEVAADELVNLLIAENVDEKCRILALTGRGGIGKTTLAQKIYNHRKMKDHFNSKVWVCVTQTFSETELLKQIIRMVKGNYGDANTTSELLPFLITSVASIHSLFLVLDDVCSADVWVKLLAAPLQTANTSVRVLVTTRYEDVAKVMKAASTHTVKTLSTESSWEMLRKLLSEGEEELSDELKQLGFHIVEKCGGFPLAIKAMADVLETRERTTEEWQNILRSDAWSIKEGSSRMPYV